MHSINGCIGTRILSPITSEPTRIAVIGAVQFAPLVGIPVTEVKLLASFMAVSVNLLVIARKKQV